MRKQIGIAVLAALLVLAAGGCSTLAVAVPRDMQFVSTGDFTPGVKTLGIVQQKRTVIAPLLIVDVNGIRQSLYENLIQKARDAGATGLTNIRFSWKPSPWTFLSALVGTAILDFYVEGFAIVER